MGDDTKGLQVKSDDKAESHCEPPLGCGSEASFHLHGVGAVVRVGKGRGVFTVCGYTIHGAIPAGSTIQGRRVRCERDGTLILQMSREV